MRRTAEPDAVSLTAGIALVVLGIVLLLDSTGTIELDSSAMAPIVLGTIGAILLASGRSRARRQR